MRPRGVQFMLRGMLEGTTGTVLCICRVFRPRNACRALRADGIDGTALKVLEIDDHFR